MRNIERISRFIAKHGADNLMIHTIFGTQLWLFCQKIGKDEWLMSLLDPMKFSVFNLGVVSNKDHLDIWMQLVRREVKIKAKTHELAQEYADIIRNFLKTKRYVKSKTQNHKKLRGIEKSAKWRIKRLCHRA